MEGKDYLLSGQQFNIIYDDPSDLTNKLETDKSSDILKLFQEFKILNVDSNSFI